MSDSHNQLSPEDKAANELLEKNRNAAHSIYNDQLDLLVETFAHNLKGGIDVNEILAIVNGPLTEPLLSRLLEDDEISEDAKVSIRKKLEETGEA